MRTPLLALPLVLPPGGALWQPMIGLLGVWVALSILIQAGAAWAAALARRKAPACFHPDGPPLPASPSVRLAFLGDLQRGVLDVPAPLSAALREADVDLLISSGDFVSHGEAPYYGVLLAAFERAEFTTPVRVVPGNHDLWPRRSKDDRIGGRLFEQRFGARHWVIDTGPVLLIGLDNGADWLLDDQLSWLQATLRASAGQPWICVCHRPPRLLDQEGMPPPADLEALVVELEAHPPALVVSGHLHAYRDETVNGVRYIVNAHGGDVHGLGLLRNDFELLQVHFSTEAEMTIERTRHRRKRSWRTAGDQLAVRLWSDRRKPLGAFLGLPAGLLLKLIGRQVPVVRLPVERRLPERAVLQARRRVPLPDESGPA